MKNILRLLVGGFSAAFFVLAAHAANLAPGAYSAGSVKGDVSYKVGSGQYAPLTAGVALPQGATIKTGANSSALIVFGSGSTAAIDANSEVEISKFVQDVFSGPVPVDAEPAVSETEIKIIDGGVTSKVSKLKKGSSFSVSSPVGAAGVRGTAFRYTFSKATGKAKLTVSEGVVNFVNPGSGGKSATIAAGKKLDITTSGNDVILDISDLSAADIKEITDALGAAAAAGLITFENKNGQIVITPVDPTQVSVN